MTRCAQESDQMRGHRSDKMGTGVTRWAHPGHDPRTPSLTFTGVGFDLNAFYYAEFSGLDGTSEKTLVHARTYVSVEEAQLRHSVTPSSTWSTQLTVR